MKKVKEIIYIGSASGNPGCTNGNYDEEYCVKFADGTQDSVFSCRCGNGCNGSFPINCIHIGDSLSDAEWEALLFDEF